MTKTETKEKAQDLLFGSMTAIVPFENCELDRRANDSTVCISHDMTKEEEEKVLAQMFTQAHRVSELFNFGITKEEIGFTG
tara:strand:+ start:32 stop:274 length:243 start_codon:yes stop_codon:yes gene_type:complete